MNSTSAVPIRTQAVSPVSGTNSTGGPFVSSHRVIAGEPSPDLRGRRLGGVSDGGTQRRKQRQPREVGTIRMGVSAAADADERSGEQPAGRSQRIRRRGSGAAEVGRRWAAGRPPQAPRLGRARLTGAEQGAPCHTPAHQAYVHHGEGHDEGTGKAWGVLGPLELDDLGDGRRRRGRRQRRLAVADAVDGALDIGRRRGGGRPVLLRGAQREGREGGPHDHDAEHETAHGGRDSTGRPRPNRPGQSSPNTPETERSHSRAEGRETGPRGTVSGRG